MIDDIDDMEISPPTVFEVRILIKHAFIDPTSINNRLGIRYSNAWGVGEQRRTPKGTILNGTYEYTMWNYSKWFEFSGGIENEIDEILLILSGNLTFVREIVRTGGVVSVILNIPGNKHFFGEISQKHMHSITTLGIKFEFEVFPENND